ncbi:hypothetical protein R3P38DRAFT_3190812 [Favolaschia claudopus]|uniref:Uncharacterized protein n=1 Tax=Favolaschia claudopus TaxID=2862362 RepID=A0AAW0BL69_9AGAR
MASPTKSASKTSVPATSPRAPASSSSSSSESEDTRPAPLDSDVCRRLSKLPISLSASAPRAEHWAPFDVEAARNFHELNHIDEPPISDQVQRIKAFYPIIREYRKRENIPPEVELFLWSSARLILGVIEALSAAKLKISNTVRLAYNAARPAQSFRCQFDMSDRTVNVIPETFLLPKIAKKVVRVRNVVESDVEAVPQGIVSVDDSDAPLAKRRKMEAYVAVPPHPAPAPAAPSEPVAPPVVPVAPVDPRRIISITHRDELLAIALTMPKDDTPAPALMKIPHHYIQDSLNPPLYSNTAFPCIECVSHLRRCPGIDESTPRATSCAPCAQTHKKCSLNWPANKLMKLIEQLRPYQNLAPQTIASYLQKLYQATLDSEHTAALHARALSAQRLAAQDLAVVVRNADNSMVDAAFTQLFEDPADAVHLRDAVDSFFDLEPEFFAQAALLADNPTTSVIPPPAGSVEDTRGTFHPAFSSRSLPRPLFGEVDASLLPGTLEAPLERDPAPHFSSAPLIRPAVYVPPVSSVSAFLDPSSVKPSYGPAGVSKRKKVARAPFVEGSSKDGQEEKVRRRSKRKQTSP